jgi:hypothetical protein
MEEEMEERHVEGLATRGGPESCVVAREGGGEALIDIPCRLIVKRRVSTGFLW